MASVVINTSTSGDNALNIGVAGKYIRVRGWVIIGSAAVNVTLKDGTTAFTGPMPSNAPGVVTGIDADGNGWYTSVTAGADIKVNLSGAVQVSGILVYDVVG